MASHRVLSAIPVLQVADVRASVEWYADVLDWRPGFVWPETGAPEHGSVCRDDAVVHLSKCADAAAHRSHVYLIVRDVRAYGELVSARGATFEFGPADTDYGMHEFSLRDPDGNTLTFGQSRSDDE